MEIALGFKRGLGMDIGIWPAQEQTFYPGFFDLIETLEEKGLMSDDNSKMLVNNCWGLANIKGFIKRAKEHYF